MLKLIRSSVLSAIAAWAWHNRATIIEKVKAATDRPKPADTATGYADVIGNKGIMTENEFARAAKA